MTSSLLLHSRWFLCSRSRKKKYLNLVGCGLSCAGCDMCCLLCHKLCCPPFTAFLDIQCDTRCACRAIPCVVKQYAVPCYLPCWSVYMPFVVLHPAPVTCLSCRSSCHSSPIPRVVLVLPFDVPLVRRSNHYLAPAVRPDDRSHLSAACGSARC